MVRTRAHPTGQTARRGLPCSMVRPVPTCKRMWSAEIFKMAGTSALSSISKDISVPPSSVGRIHGGTGAATLSGPKFLSSNEYVVTYNILPPPLVTPSETACREQKTRNSESRKRREQKTQSRKQRTPAKPMHCQGLLQSTAASALAHTMFEKETNTSGSAPYDF